MSLFIIKICSFLFHVSECWHVCMCTMYMLGALRGQKKHGVPGIGVTDACEPSCDAENQTGSIARTAGALN